jgi:D-alanyl-D-alanine carboxypeptidase (penicillin-binding protein 5/6)
MKHLTALLALVCLSLAASAQAQPIPDPPATAGESYILMDAASGRVLAAKNPDKRLSPASLTKIMTSYVVYKALDSGSVALKDNARVSEAAWKMGGSQMFLEVDKPVTVDKLLDGLVVQSGNDAALALAEHVGGSETAFVQQMNHYADELGLENTHFANPEGLSVEGHYSSARDLAALSRSLIQEFPERYARYAKREFTYNGIRQHNRNELLYSDASVDGLKTGYTEQAGYCLAAAAKRDGMRLISVVMGEPSADKRMADSRALLGWGYRFYESHQLYAAGDVLKQAPIWEGAASEVPLGLTEALHVTVAKGEYENLSASMTFPGRLVAPADKGAELGRVVVTNGDKTVAEAPLVALSAVAQGSLVQRMTDTVLQWFQ